MSETWKPAPGWEDRIEVSNLGRVRTLSGKIVPQSEAGAGYLRVGIVLNGKTVTVYPHVLVLTAFDAPRPADKECNHKNGDKHDNRIVNLEWVTHAQNIAHSYRVLGRKPPGLKGEAHGMAKLTEAEVCTILKESKRGVTRQKLADRFGVSSMLISLIARGILWKHIKR